MVRERRPAKTEPRFQRAPSQRAPAAAEPSPQELQRDNAAGARLPPRGRCSRMCHGWSRSWSLAFSYTVADIRRDKRNFFIGICTIFISVMFISFLQNAIARSPTVFIKLTESTSGEDDMLLDPLSSNYSNPIGVNQSYVDQALVGVDVVAGSTPRWTLLASIRNPERNDNGTTVILLAINSTREKAIGLGRSWRYRPISSGECYVSSSVLRVIGVTPRMGKDAIISLSNSFSAFGGGGFGSSTDLTAQVASQLNVDNTTAQAIIQNLGGTTALLGSLSQITCKVVDHVPYPDGKFPASLGNVAIIDAATLQPLLGALIGGNVQDSAFQSVVMFKNRFSLYTLPSQARDTAFVQRSNAVMEALGYNFPAEPSLPVLSGFGQTEFISLFLDQIFVAVLIVLVFLGCMLIYSLQIGDVEEKTFEYGMLRALGMYNGNVIVLLIVQALFYAVPGTIFAFTISFSLNVALAAVFGVAAQAPFDISFSPTAAGIGVTLGLGMPLLANIAPIKRALSHTLRDSLDLYHTVQSESTVRTQRLENLGLSAWQLSLSIVLVVIGFVVYYLVPYAFTFNDLPLFFFIFNIILLGMVFGFSLIAQMFQPWLELGCLHVLVCGRDKKLRHIITKNLASHRNRNRKTAIMFTTAVSFVIFAGAMFTLQADSIGDQIRSAFGSDLSVQTFSWDTRLPETDLRKFLDAEIAKQNTTILSYTFTTHPITRYDLINATRFSALSNFRTWSISVVGVERNFLDVAYQNFWVPTETPVGEFAYSYIRPTAPDLIKSMYDQPFQMRFAFEPSGAVTAPETIVHTATSANTQYNVALNGTVLYQEYYDILVGESLRPYGGVTTKLPIRLTTYIKRSSRTQTLAHLLCKVRGMLSKVPGFAFSSYQLLGSGSTILMTMDNYRRLLLVANDNVVNKDEAETFNSVADIPKSTLLIKLRSGTTQLQRDDVINSVRNLLTSSLIFVTDTEALVASTKTATDLISLFFNIIALIAILLSFFILWLSFNANVRENLWEFGVMRSVGLTGWEVLRVYVYEGLALVISCVILGSIIGLLVAITLTLQFNIFTELPFTFVFPFQVFVFVVIMSLIVAVFGSYLPARSVMEREIALVLRGL